MAAPLQYVDAPNFDRGVRSMGTFLTGETTGIIFFVDSTATATKGDDTNHGRTPQSPFATIDFAIGQCQANRGDIIKVLPGHAETVTADGGINLDVAGVTIEGLGSGRDRPIITFASSTAASITLNAASCRLRNLVFDLTGIDGIGNAGGTQAAIRMLAADGVLEYCELIVATSGNQAACAVAVSTAGNRCRINNNLIAGSATAGPESAIRVYGTGALTLEGVRIYNNSIIGDFSASAIRFDLTDIVINASISENEITNTGTNQACLFFGVGAGSSGVVRNNTCIGSVVAALYTQVATGFANVDNYGYDSDTAGQLGEVIPQVGYTLPASKSLIDQILGQEFSYHQANYLAVPVDFSSATWNTVASHEILAFGADDMSRVIIIPECTTDLTSGGGATIQLGIEGATDAFIAATTATDIDDGEMWLGTTPAKQFAKSSVIDRIVSGGIDIGYEIAVAALTGGAITFHCWVIPLNGNAQRYPVAGAGGSL